MIRNRHYCFLSRLVHNIVLQTQDDDYYRLGWLGWISDPAASMWIFFRTLIARAVTGAIPHNQQASPSPKRCRCCSWSTEKLQVRVVTLSQRHREDGLAQKGPPGCAQHSGPLLPWCSAGSTGTPALSHLPTLCHQFMFLSHYEEFYFFLRALWTKLQRAGLSMHEPYRKQCITRVEAETVWLEGTNSCNIEDICPLPFTGDRSLTR